MQVRRDGRLGDSGYWDIRFGTTGIVVFGISEELRISRTGTWEIGIRDLRLPDGYLIANERDASYGMTKQRYETKEM